MAKSKLKKTGPNAGSSKSPSEVPGRSRAGKSRSNKVQVASTAFPYGLLSLQVFLIVAAALWIYWPALRGDFLWDDSWYIGSNALMHDPNRLWKAWFEPGSFVEYYPIEQSLQWFQWRLWGNATLGYHLTNVLLHIISSLLVWRLLSKFGLKLAWLGGLLFAIHPVQVESVAYVSEFKNTLSLPPFLLAMGAWVDFEERRRPRDYGCALAFFLVAMLCKISMAPFPVIMLLYAWWKRNRIQERDLWATAPFFLIALFLGTLTVLSGIWYQGANVKPEDLLPMGGFFSRLALAGQTFCFYFSQCFFPLHILPFYARWPVNPPAWWQFYPIVLFGSAGWWLWKSKTVWGRHVLLGLGFFLLNLAPFLGFKEVTYMSFTWVMNHFLYIPIIGLIGLVVAGVSHLHRQLSSIYGAGIFGLVTAACLWLTLNSQRYAGKFVSEEALWNYTLQQDPSSWPAHNDLGSALEKQGRLTEALQQYEDVLQLNPDLVWVHCNIGAIYLKMGNMARGIKECEKASLANPGSAELHYLLGNALFTGGRIPDAIAQFQRAVQIKPDFMEALANLGQALQHTEQNEQAIPSLEAALRINPDLGNTHFVLGLAFQRTSRLPEAMEQYRAAVRLSPGNAEAHNNLGNALLQLGQTSEAVAQYQQALQVQPNDASAYVNLGNAWLLSGQIPTAMEQYQRALQLQPNNAEAHNNLGYSLEQSGRIAEAIQHYQEALSIKPDYAAARNSLARATATAKGIPQKR